MTRRPLTKELLDEFFKALASTAPKGGHFHVLVTGGGTAVDLGWRDGTIDVDVAANRDAIFQRLPDIIRRLDINVEFAKPTDFVPGLRGYEGRHIFICSISNVSFHHFDPYTQCFSKIVRGFQRDILDASHFLKSGLVDSRRLLDLVNAIPEAAFLKYPSLEENAVREAVRDFLKKRG